MTGRAFWTDDRIREFRGLYEGGWPMPEIMALTGRSRAALKHIVIKHGFCRQRGATAYLTSISSSGEEWRSVDGFSGYFVSSAGRIASMRDGATILKPWRDRDGYHHVGLSLGAGRAKRQAVARLVARAFVGGFAPGLDVCHESRNLSDNSATNLRWDTHVGNCADKHRHGTQQFGSRHPRALCTEAKARAAKEALASGVSIGEAAATAGISYHIAVDIKRGRTWGHA